ncbi:MAG: hypothetical protein BV459_03985 [Thermoplasmata archaeon M11B2D]|nr:MAG: hypothetical protein BV459_03985 [Thermoplasmata archaeon M11B2D]
MIKDSDKKVEDEFNKFVDDYIKTLDDAKKMISSAKDIGALDRTLLIVTKLVQKKHQKFGELHRKHF